MTETAPKTKSDIPDLSGVPETTASKFKIETFDDIRRVMTIAKGGDPDAIQAITNFMDLKSNIERSYFPDKRTTICVGQLEGFGRLYFPTNDGNPFRLVADCLAVAFMPYKGFKSNQFVDMTRQTPNLADLQTTVQGDPRGVLDRILRRGTTE